MRWFLLTAFLIAAALANSGAAQPRGKPAASSFLSTTHYLKTCPDLERLIHQRVSAWVKRDPTLAASIIRLHFHDCAVRGCDASVLLNHRGSERAAEASRGLRGFNLIDEIKAVVEKHCPKTVSCADILTAAARDATVLAGGPFWEVPFGRKDGRVSVAREANTVPQGHENITALINYFDKLGLTFVDMVVLSGAHTIGRSSCHAIKDRINNFNGTRRPDPSMNLNYVKILRRKCRSDADLVDLDVKTPRKFDVAYYGNLGKRMGLLSTDQLMFADERTGGVVSVMAAQAGVFMSQFAVAMTKLGDVNVLVGKQGEVRRNCNFVNA